MFSAFGVELVYVTVSLRICFLCLKPRGLSRVKRLLLINTSDSCAIPIGGESVTWVSLKQLMTRELFIAGCFGVRLCGLAHNTAPGVIDLAVPFGPMNMRRGCVLLLLLRAQMHISKNCLGHKKMQHTLTTRRYPYSPLF